MTTFVNQDEIPDLIADLREGVCQVIFQKVDGTERVMFCTLREDHIPQEPDPNEGLAPNDPNRVFVKSKNIRIPNPDVISVWDLDKEAWRSFRKDSVMDWDCVLPDEAA